MKEIVAMVILCLPLLNELFDDAKGDDNKKLDVVLRILLCAAAGICNMILTDHSPWLAFNLALAIHFMFFDYLVHIILYRNGVIVSPKWFSYLGKSSKVDKIPIWKTIGPYGRLFVKLGYFLVSLYLYLTI